MQNYKNPTIAIIDSGIGGVSVLNQIVQKFKAGNYIYLADNLNMPYGNKSKNWLRKRTLYLIKCLKEKYVVDYVIVACNTASSAILDIKDKRVYKLKFNKNETYLATKLTKYNLNEIKVIADNRLAKQIESNIFNKKILNQIVKQHVKIHNLRANKRIVLGCTHFELVKEFFEKFCEETKFINNSSFLIDELDFKISLSELNIMVLLTKNNEVLKDKIIKLIRS
ncbi:MAG: hypothetical protein IKY10_04695 [Clostridia bacterium]|nr:hypothetical protein [Clostridia bacterium]